MVILDWPEHDEPHFSLKYGYCRCLCKRCTRKGCICPECPDRHLVGDEEERKTA